ncbi:MAG TPA: patatin-like phospholipase family protein [Bryobacteraceae bacterium]|nr:patatin-like phospholipase family protein [Bryobacteraceae bacterium]
MTRHALVLGGGGYAASAWEIGLIKGMAQAGHDIRNADLFVGTSAGARVALHLASGVALEELFRRQIGPSPRSAESPSVVDWLQLRGELARAKEAGGGRTAVLRRIGSLALAAAGGKGSDRRQIVSAQLPIQTWPDQKLFIVAVNAETGERRAFDRTSGIELVDAVIASSAFFGWPPALFEGHHYIDGGFYSSDNADLATGFDRVLILAIRASVSSLCVVSLDAAVKTLRRRGARVDVIPPDEGTLEAFASVGSVMNPMVCAPAAEAGRLQGRRLVAERVLSVW